MALVLLFSLPTKAEDWVEVRTKDEVYESYRQRRGTHGWQFAVGQELFRPEGFASSIDGLSYDSAFGASDIPLLAFETGYKYNFAMGSLSALFGYGAGQIADSKAGELRTLKIEKMSAKGMLILDALMEEPYAAPYASFGVYRIGADESAATQALTFEGSTGIGTCLSAGLLIQLNWLEDDVSRASWLNSGMENTYLDVFMAQYGKTSQDDPDFSTGMNWGAGLRIEF